MNPDEPQSVSPDFSFRTVKLFVGDCLDWLDTQPDNSLHACVTDPPYGLVEYSSEQLAKLRAGSGGTWRIPPAYDGHARSPLPRFTAAVAVEAWSFRAGRKRRRDGSESWLSGLPGGLLALPWTRTCLPVHREGVAGRSVFGVVRQVVRVKLRPSVVQAAALARTLAACNEAANRVSVVAFEKRAFRKWDLQKIAYGQVRSLGLSAQPAVRTIGKVADAYATVHANARAGNYGKRGSKRYERAMGKPVVFRPDAAQPFDDRCLSWQMDARTVSIWSVDGRLKGVPFVGEAGQLDLLAKYRKGESDLIEHQGTFYLVATVDIPEAAPFAPRGFLGVDLGVVNIATTSDGTRISGAAVNRVRHRNRRLRSKLQQKGTKSSKRVLKRLSGREQRFGRDVNHRVSTTVVAEAVRTGRGIALEDLTGIRERVRSRKPQRARLSSWSFAQLGAFIAYKALRAGVPVVFVDPRYTSQDCSECGHRSRKNRPDQATFTCRKCGMSLHADENAAINIAHRGADDWGAVNRPYAA